MRMIKCMIHWQQVATAAVTKFRITILSGYPDKFHIIGKPEVMGDAGLLEITSRVARVPVRNQKQCSPGG